MMVSPIDGIRYRIQWVETNLNNLIEHIESVIVANEHAIGIENDIERRKIIFHAHNFTQVHPHAGVIIGTIAHNLRAVLDNLVWELALLNTPKPYWRGAFPILLRARTKTTGKKKPKVFYSADRGCGLDYLQSLSRRHIKMIEAFQPYKRRNGGLKNPLFLLSELNNTDKHRAIHVGAAFLEIRSVTAPIVPGISVKNVRYFNTRCPTTEGLKLAEISYSGGPPKGRFEIKGEYTSSVLFLSGADVIRYKEVAETLRSMTTIVVEVVNAFIPEFR